MRLLLLLSVSFWQLSAVSLAAPVNFNIDPARSTLVLSGTFGGNQLDTWSFGSSDAPILHDGFTTSYRGTIVADRDAAAGTFQITGSNLVAQNIPGFAFGPPNDSPASCNYVFFTSLTSDFSSSSTFEGAIRELSLSLRGPLVPDS